MFNSVTDAKKTIGVLKEKFKDSADAGLFRMLEALFQLFDIVAAVNKREQVLTPVEISGVGDQGLMIIENLAYELFTQNKIAEKNEVEQLALVIASWVITHHGELRHIQSVVDALAYMANAVEDKVSLLQLSAFMNQFANACTKPLQHDLENTDPSRPWLTLNMNRGIVATRSHDVDMMRKVFSDLIKAIPMDAPAFFKQGMSEMVRLNYPQQVRDVMQEYYDKTQLPQMH